MTSQGTAHGRFTCTIQRRNLFQAELDLREMRDPSFVLVDYLELLADVRPDISIALRFAGMDGSSLGLRCSMLAESQLALAALGASRVGHRDAVDVLRKLLRRVHPTLLPRVS